MNEKRIHLNLEIKILIFVFIGLIFQNDRSYSQVILEAENAYYSSGIIDTKHPGYTGAGFVDLENASGEYLEWFINTTDSVTHEMDFRYALGKDEHRLMEAYINSSLIDTIDFDSTYLFTNYKYKSFSAKLDSGLNRVKLLSINDQGAPNLDHLRIYSDTAALPAFGVIFSTDGNGTVNFDPVSDSFHYGTRVIATAEPKPGYSFLNWSGDLESFENPLIIVVDKNMALMAGFINSLPAFPGAEGFGQNVTGGRGGDVYQVTNLNDDGAGSLRYAVEQTGKRTIVFRISGTIHLASALKISNSDITIAGQTAPGDGICLAGYPLSVEANNVIIRYIRSRLGDASLIEDDAMKGKNCSNVILDHCTMSWSVDEAASFYDNTNFTMQYCIISESLFRSVHDKGDHGYGGIWGGKGVTYHHNLLASHTSRNPRFCGSRYSNLADLELIDFRNNVIFNWAGNSGYGGEGGHYNIVNNYYKYGTATNFDIRDRIFAPNADIGDNAQPAGIWGKFYVNGNYINKIPNTTSDNWKGIDPNPSSKPVSEIKSDSEFEVDSITTQTAQIAFEHVLAQAGVSIPNRDSVDMRIIKEVLTGKLTYGSSYGAGTGIIDSQEDVGGWPELNSTTPPKDTDHDGIPDYWETAHGLSISDPADRNNDDNANGYTNLEEYLNELVSNTTYIIRPLNFDAQKTGSKTVNLTWDDVVENETGFLIERSDGEGYMIIAIAAANSASYEDLTPTYGNYTYRLRAVNNTDTSFYSDTAYIRLITDIKSNNELESNISIYPNPFSTDLFIQINAENSDEPHVRLFNISGYQLDMPVIKKYEGGSYFYRWADVTVPAGIYFLSVQSNSGLIFKKIIKLTTSDF